MNKLDAKDLFAIRELCQGMSEAELVRFCEGVLRMAAAAQSVLLERFPDAWKALDADAENGRLWTR